VTDRQRKLPYYDFFMREVNKPSYKVEAIYKRENPGVGFGKSFFHYRVTFMRGEIPYSFEFSAGSALVYGYIEDLRILVDDVLESLVTDSSYYLAGEPDDGIPVEDEKERKEIQKLIKRNYKLMLGLFGRKFNVLVKLYENGDMEQ